MKRTLSILGSTGSIGRQTLEVAEACGHRVAALTVNRSVDLAEEQARKFRPELVAAVDETAAAELRIRLADTPIRVVSGREGLMEAACLPAADTVVTAVVGIAGLEPTLAAIDAGKRIALANKETLVCAGELVMDRAAEKGRGDRAGGFGALRHFPVSAGPAGTEERCGGSSSPPPAGRFSAGAGRNWPTLPGRRP